MDTYQQILGILYGHAYGDAAGSRLEFRGIPSQHEIKRAMELAGGGVFKLNPGQITDDGELTLQVFRALYNYFVENNDTEVIGEDGEILEIGPLCDLDDLFFQNFREWYDSRPFDIGHTTRNAFYKAPTKYDMVENVKMLNTFSESNGALMRSCPHAIFAYMRGISEQEMYDIIEMDVQFTHVKKCVVNMVYAYNIIILYLLKGKDTDEIYVRLTEIANELDDQKLSDLIDNYMEHPDITKNIGWDKNAFSLVLYCLFNDYSFEKAIEYTLSQGGDTDTNAAIVGGVMGARYGTDAVPFIDKIYNCNTAHDREEFHPKEYVDTVAHLVEKYRGSTPCPTPSG